MEVRKTRSDKISFNEEEVLVIEDLAGKFLSIKAISHYFGIATETFNRRVEDDVKVKNALRRGRAKGLAELNSIAHRKALDGDSGMLKYLLGRYDNLFMSKEDKDPQFSGEIYIDSDRS